MSQTSFVGFRARPQLVQALSAAAEQGGLTVSDLVRQAVEDRLSAFASEPGTPAAFDPFDKLTAAGRGSLQAQRDLAHEAARMAFRRGPDGQLVNDPECCIRDGLLFARLAASHGEIGDQGLVISMLALLAEMCGEEACEGEMAEAIARISLVADGGVELAADMLPGLAEGVSPVVMALAKDYRERIKDILKQGA